ncbi:unnamed protein product [Urochloa decumbens]|uniref:F-box domain-containing protein n=1 Tax=Urochloa decumbens TaxID=240449 RepID=A0ABC9BWG9_9POAL
METPALQSEQQRPRQTLASNGLVAPVDEIQGSHSPCHRVDGDDSKDGEASGYSIPELPQDIWRHIHSLMPMDEAARAACVSHAFLSFWRCYPKLTLSWQMLCSKAKVGSLRRRINSILRNHTGIGLKILRLNLRDQDSSFPYINSWLQVAVTPGIEELTLELYEKYKFPCSILSIGVRNSLRSLQLDSCVFHPTPELGPLRSLTRLILRSVHITGDELEGFLSNSLALEHLDLYNCKKIIILKVSQEYMEHESIFTGSSHLRQLPECCHDHLKSVEIIGFSSAKSLVELTCYIVKSTVSLERLTLDTLRGDGRCSGENDSDYCCSISQAFLKEASRGVAAIRKYIEDKVPPTAKLTVLEPCPRCHTSTVD